MQLRSSWKRSISIAHNQIFVQVSPFDPLLLTSLPYLIPSPASFTNTPDMKQRSAPPYAQSQAPPSEQMKCSNRVEALLLRRCALDVSWTFVVFGCDTSDGIGVLCLHELIRSLLVLLGHGARRALGEEADAAEQR